MANLGTPNTNTSQFFITLDRTEELQDKHTIFGSVIGDTIYNVMKLGEVEIGKNERPVHPPVIKNVEVIDNPFPDIVPRITSAQRKEQAKARKEAKKEKQKEKMLAKHKALAKNKGLLSFAEEEKLTETSEADKTRKLKSAHDVDASSQLSNAVIDKRPSVNQLSFPQNSSTIPENPVKVHEALRAVAGRERPGAPEASTTKAQGSLIEDSSKAKGKGKHERNPKEVNKEPSAADQVKADIIKVQAELKKMSKRRDSDSDSEEDKTKGTANKSEKRKATHDGHSLLEEERKRFKARANEKKATGRGSEAESILESFRRKLREAKPLSKPAVEEERVDGYAGEADSTQNGVLGDIDGDDEGWMAHTLQFRKDATADLHKADEYAVIDPLLERKLTLDELEARKNEKRFASRPQARNSDRRKKN